MSFIVYEHPLNEQVRALLRLAFLFRQTDHAVAGGSPWDARQALFCILQLGALCGRVELKSELGRGLRRHADALRRHAAHPGVDAATLDAALARVDACADALRAFEPAQAAALRRVELLNALRQRAGAAGGGGAADLPALHRWLQRPRAARDEQFEHWLRPLRPAHEAAELMLGLLRASERPRPTRAARGLYQQTLSTQDVPQLIRIAIDADGPAAAYYPECSGGPQRFTIRFMDQPAPADKPLQTDADVAFRLACCGL